MIDAAPPPARLPDLRQPSETEAETGQARVRLALTFIVILYVVGRWLLDPRETLPWDTAVFLVGFYLLVFSPVALVLYLVIEKTPGVFLWRRIFAMLLDYSAIALTIIAGGEPLLPIFAILIWVTVGNGLRYGVRYLFIAIGIAMASLTAMTLFTPYLWAHPNLVLTLALTVLIVPGYAVSLLRRTEEARKAALEANVAKSRFLAQASHDLRQPVHAIGLFIATLRQAGLNQGQRGIVDRIDRALQGVASLFRSLLDISTLDSGAVSPKLETVALQQLFSDLAQQNSEGSSWADIELHFVPTRRHVISDRALLTTMVQNLVSNALKYAPGKPVIVGCRLRGGALSIMVHDQGPGIDDEHMPFVRDEFYRVRNVGDADRQGVGLGLSIVDRLASIMGLSLRLVSVPGRGTTAAIDGLTMVDPRSAGRPDRPQPDAIRTPLRGVRVLLVEDDEDVLAATRELLVSWGCQVQAFTARPQECEICDVIIVDFDIGGGVTGADCIAAARAWAAQRGIIHIPAMVMTGHEEARVRALLGDERIPILKKPIRPAEMRSMIAALRMGADQGHGAPNRNART
jgi:signal transduction histidine kinase/CheY-like chemotaxis protein